MEFLPFGFPSSLGVKFPYNENIMNLGMFSGQFLIHFGLIRFWPVLAVEFCNHHRNFLPYNVSLWSVDRGTDYWPVMFIPTSSLHLLELSLTSSCPASTGKLYVLNARKVLN